MESHPNEPIRLPGVGSALELRDLDGRPLTVVRCTDASVRVYVDDEQLAEFDEVTARSIGAFMAGHYSIQPLLAERMADVIGGLNLDWIEIGAGWRCVGRSIEELSVRRATGVSIIAILRGSVPLVTPDPSTTFEEGDELVIAGRSGDLEAFEVFMSKGG